MNKAEEILSLVEAVEVSSQMKPFIEAIQKVNERYLKISPGLEQFLHSKPSPMFSEKYYEAIAHELSQIL